MFSNVLLSDMTGTSRAKGEIRGQEGVGTLPRHFSNRPGLSNRLGMPRLHFEVIKMPTVPRPGTRPLYVELPHDLVEELETLAATNRRTLKAEITVAIE